MYKKITAILALTVVCALTSKAAINVDYVLQSGLTMSDGTTPIFSTPGSAGLLQLLFTTDSNYAMPGTITAAEILNPLNATVLASVTIDEAIAGNPYGATAGSSYSGTFNAGYLFVRIFSSATPNIGDFYFQGSVGNGGLYGAIDNPGGATPNDLVNEGSVASGSGDFGTYTLTGVVVPEPSVLAFLGLGGLALAARRRFIA